MEAGVQDIEGVGNQLVDDGQLDVCITGFYDLAFIVAAKCGWDLERLLFEGSDEDLRGMCSDLSREYGSYFRKFDVKNLYDRLVLISKMGVQKYRALSVQKRKELFDLDLESIEKLGRFKVSTLLKETKWVRDVYQLREEGQMVHTIRLLVDRHVRSITVDEEGRLLDGACSDSSDGFEYSSTNGFTGEIGVYGPGGGFVLHIDVVGTEGDPVLFELLVRHLKDNGLLDRFVTLEQVVFNDDYWQTFESGLDVLVEKKLIKAKKNQEGRLSDSPSVNELVGDLKVKLGNLREVGFIKYCLLIRRPLPFVLTLSDTSIGSYKNCKEDLVRVMDEKGIVVETGLGWDVPEFVEDVDKEGDLEELRCVQELVARSLQNLKLSDVASSVAQYRRVLEVLIEVIKDDNFEPYDLDRILSDGELRNGKFKDDVDGLNLSDCRINLSGVSRALIDDLFARMDAVNRMIDENKVMYDLWSPYKWILFTPDQLGWILEVFDACHIEKLSYADLLQMDKAKMEEVRGDPSSFPVVDLSCLVKFENESCDD
jgi:hypothetical protein